MTTPDLTPTLRAALDRALASLNSIDLFHLSDDERLKLAADRAALRELRDACPERWLPTEDGLAVHVDSAGDRTIYYVRDGDVCAYLQGDGTLLRRHDPAGLAGTWEPYVHEVTPEQIARAAEDTAVYLTDIRDTLPALGCREVTR